MKRKENSIDEQMSIDWLRVGVVTFYYVGGGIGLFYLITGSCKIQTYVFGKILKKFEF